MRVLKFEFLAQRDTDIESSLAIAGYNSSLPTDNMANELYLLVLLPFVHMLIALELVDLPAPVLLSDSYAHFRHN